LGESDQISRRRAVSPAAIESIKEHGYESGRPEEQDRLEWTSHLLEHHRAEGGPKAHPQGHVDDGADQVEEDEAPIADLSRAGEHGGEEAHARGEAPDEHGEGTEATEACQGVLHATHGAEGEPAVQGEETRTAAPAERVEEMIAQQRARHARHHEHDDIPMPLRAAAG